MARPPRYRLFKLIIQNAIRQPRFRKMLAAEMWGEMRLLLPGRLVTRRRDYIWCHIPGHPELGKWLPPQNLHWRPTAYGLLFDRQGRILLVSAPALSFTWTLPGGGMHRGETQPAALKREFEEETGLVVEVGPLVASNDHFYLMPGGRPHHVLSHYYLVKAVGGTFMPEGNGFDTSLVEFVSPSVAKAKHPDFMLSLERILTLAYTIQQATGFDCYYDSPHPGEAEGG